MLSYLFGNANTTLSQTLTQYAPLNPSRNTGFATTENTRQEVMPAAYTLSNFTVTLNSAPGVGTSYAFTVRKNSVDTTLKVTISDTGLTATDSTHSVSFVAGDLVSISVVPTGTPAQPTSEFWSIQCSGTGHPLLAQVGQTASVSATQYTGLGGASNSATISWSTTEYVVDIVVPCAGTISNLRIALDGTTGATGTYTVTLMKNAATTALTATVAIAGSTASDVTHSVSVIAGDLISIQCVPALTPTARRMAVGVQFTPTTDGQAFFGMGNAATGSTSATQYEQVIGVGNNGWNGNETFLNMQSPPITVNGLYVNIGSAPGGSASRTFVIRRNFSDSLAKCVVSAANTAANVTGVNMGLNLGDALDVSCAVASSPATMTNGLHLGVLYVVPTSTAVAPRSGMLTGVGS